MREAQILGITVELFGMSYEVFNTAKRLATEHDCPVKFTWNSVNHCVTKNMTMEYWWAEHERKLYG
jgi:hypothetical protein